MGSAKKSRQEGMGWVQGHPTVRCGKLNISSEGLKSPDNLGLIAVKAKDLFGEASRWTFVKEDLSKFLLFTELHRLAPSRPLISPSIIDRSSNERRSRERSTCFA